MGLSDNHLIYCNRKFLELRQDPIQQELSKLNFPNYQNNNDINKTYNHFIHKIIKLIDKFAPMKEEG